MKNPLTYACFIKFSPSQACFIIDFHPTILIEYSNLNRINIEIKIGSIWNTFIIKITHYKHNEIKESDKRLISWKFYQ